MDDDLKAIKDAWEGRNSAGIASSNPDGVDLSGDQAARDLADAYVESHAEDFAGMENLSLDLLVKAVDDYREKGQEAEQWKVEAWLLHHFDPQEIGGTYQPKLRITNG